jgi:hypothetical protein
VRTKNLIALGASIALVLVMVLTGCGQATTAPSTPSTPSTPSAPQVVTKTVQVEMTYKALNPVGIFIPVETKALAKRLDTIVGKTIYICQGEADPLIMPALYKVMVAKYPQTKFLYYDVSAFGPNVPGTGTTPAKSTGLPEPTDIFTKADACIRGIGW